MDIRDATIADAGGIATVRVRGWQAAYRGLLPDDGLDRLSIERDTDIWRSRLESPSPDGVMVVADIGEILGFCSGGPDRDDDSLGEIYALYVHPDRWHGGIGTRLLDVASGRLAAAGFTELVLWVLATNTPARRFYESRGWVHDGAEKGDEIFGFALYEARYRKPAWQEGRPGTSGSGAHM
jgi:ribosomal protein S18 acetylase RimI-like enzyme